MGLFKKLFGTKKEEKIEVVVPEPIEPVNPVKNFYFNVAGISFKEDEIKENLLLKNDEYSMTKRELIDFAETDVKIYKYIGDIAKVELVPEPDNPYDKKAIKVIADGIHIGYVPKDWNERTGSTLRNHEITRISCELYGGPYKILVWDYDDYKDKDIYTIERGKTNIGAKVTVYYKEK